MSFTSDIKKEIVALGFDGTAKTARALKTAALSAYVRTSGALGFKDGMPNFFLVSETENVAEFFIKQKTQSPADPERPAGLMLDNKII